MKKTYPVVMLPGKEFIVVFIPDFNINTQGKDIQDAIEMARDAIGLVGIDMEEDGETIPEPSAVKDIVLADREIVSLVDVDFAEYRRKNNMQYV